MPEQMSYSQLRRIKREQLKFDNCVYLNPNYDYKKSRFIYNQIYCRPGFLECTDSTNKQLDTISNKIKPNLKLMTSVANPKIVRHKPSDAQRKSGNRRARRFISVKNSKFQSIDSKEQDSKKMKL